MRAAQILFSQGFGSRRECAALLAAGRLQIAGRAVEDGNEEFDEAAGLVYTVDGIDWPFHASALVVMNKPAGHECSRQPRHHPGVLSLLPLPLQRRGLQPVGRLDEDTTGLLLLTDDGPLIHRLTSPKWHVPKVYEVTTRHAVDEAQVQALLAGVVLHDDPLPVCAAACLRVAECALRLTLTDGRYHQVKRMLAAVGNRVDALHRSAFGALALPADLAPGGWRWLTAEEKAALAP
ncbi:Pseudouridine synthase [Rubrivivax sp. A210]|uniref:16S rRNA pseudouridine(516) synthase n=1 Tax=Rubrivivax sp. A210 TaxID=2772301 RepID=UPI0019191DC7|nr:pseudouridine synthase [Rubrivivax sp. A210]CAD5366965.1 Pseudouridine synthase [Rubrivivax sp. A210]